MAYFDTKNYNFNHFSSISTWKLNVPFNGYFQILLTFSVKLRKSSIFEWKKDCSLQASFLKLKKRCKHWINNRSIALRMESFNWKISINGSVGFYRSKRTAFSLFFFCRPNQLIASPHQIFPVQCILFLWNRNNMRIFPRLSLLTPQRKAVNILCVFFSSISFDTVEMKFSMKLTFFSSCDGCLWLVILWMHDFCWASNRRPKFHSV